MNASELASLRDRVARARLEVAAKGKPKNIRGWSEERLEAASSALVALRAAEAPVAAPAPQPKKAAPPIPPEVTSGAGPRKTVTCVYCGSPTERDTKPPACHNHRGLAAHDPYYQA